jgi:predicted  nucleic acid-binding Zn-ribbon protein
VLLRWKVKGVVTMEVKIEHRLTEVEERAKSNSHRLDEVEKRQDNLEKLTSTVEVLAVREKSVEADVKEIKCDVKNLTNKPAQRWESVITQIITIIVAAAVGYFLSKIGL